MRCDRVLSHLDALRTGELSPDEIAAIERHLNLCPPCERSLSDLKRLAADVRRLMGGVPSSCLEAVRAALVDYYDVLPSPLGELWVAFGPLGIKKIALMSDSEEEPIQDYRLESRREIERSALPVDLRRQVMDAIEGRGEASSIVDLEHIAKFRRRVLEVLSSIPRGEVRTYAWVAREAGRPRAVRAAASACAANPVPFLLPCHRVVPAAGGTGKYALGTALKREILRREGVPLERLDRLEKQGIRYVGYPDDGAYCFPTCSGAFDDPGEHRVLLHDEKEAAELGLEPCPRCRPLAA